MSAFEKIIKLEQEFDNRKVEIQLVRTHKVKTLEAELKLKQEKVEQEVKQEVETIRKSTQQEVKQMHEKLKAKLEANKKAFSDAFIKDKEKIVDQIFTEVKRL